MTADAVQELYDDIPAHAAQPMTIDLTDGGLAMAGSLDVRSARGAGVDQVHGGVLAALLDTAATLVLVAADGESWSTVDIRVDYLRPVALGDCRVEASVLRAGRRVARSTARLTGGDGGLCAAATGTFVR